jgi:hypothetical protein
MQLMRKPEGKPVHTFLQMGGIALVALGVVLNVVGLVSLLVSASGAQPPRLLVLSLIGVPLAVIGFVMMAVGFTAAAKRIRKLAEEPK